MIFGRLRIKLLTQTCLFALVLPISLCAAEDKLVRAVCLVRHGERTPWSGGYANLRYSWPYPMGELTPAGAHQAFLVGRQYGGRYITNLHLLPPHYVAGSMRVVSTPLNRTILSAQALIAGLYSPSEPRLDNGQWSGPTANAGANSFDFRKIPVLTIPGGRKGNLLSKEQEDPQLFSANINAVLKTPAFVAVNRSHQTDFARWGTLVGAYRTFATVWDLIGVSDYLSCMLHATPPCPLPPGLSTDEANRIIDAGFTNEAALCSTELMTRYMAGDFMKQLCADFVTASRANEDCKLTLYVGHDISILPIMAALKTPLATNTPYAAHLEFELYQSDSGNYTVRVFYQNSTIRFSDNDNPTLAEFTNAVRWVTAP